MIKAVPHVAAMSPYALADLGGAGAVSMAQNESAFSPSPAAIKAGQAALESTALYPDPDWQELRASIANVHGLKPGQILCGAGSMELISALFQGFVGKGDTVLGSRFGSALGPLACGLAQAEFIAADEPGYAVSVESLMKQITPQIRMVYLCNPGNPTGTLIANAKLIELREALPADVLLVIDQAYGEFGDMAQNRAELFALVERGNTVILRSFSKAYGLAGARVGWGYFPPDVAVEMRKLLNPNNISAVSQAMATAAMDDQQYMQKVVAQTSDIRDKFARDLRELGIQVPPSYTNFVLLRFETAEMAGQVDQALRAQGLMMRAMGGYGLPHCLRATICAPDVMERALSVLRQGKG